MSPTFLSTVGRIRRRCRRWLGGDFDYQAAYRKAPLDQSYWRIIGAETREEFEVLGRVKRQLLIGLGLTPEGRVLDVGCGTGALTATLEEFLGPEGLYYGTDIAEEAVAFCRRRFTRPNFVFARNELTRLPIEGIHFDFIYFGSVFTHVYPEEIRALLVEVKRLLDPQGRIIADLFVEPDVHRFRGDRGMVVIDEAHLLEVFAATGLQHALFGSWPCAPEVHQAYRNWPCGPATLRSTYTFFH
jgi:ubiquinone/menaquinone biosynthesis C-methylase UbiE